MVILRLDRARRVLLADRRQQRARRRQDVDLARRRRPAPWWRRPRSARAARPWPRCVRSLSCVVPRTTATFLPSRSAICLICSDFSARHDRRMVGIGDREVDDLGAVRRDRQGRDDEVGLVGLQHRDARRPGGGDDLELDAQILGQQPGEYRRPSRSAASCRRSCRRAGSRVSMAIRILPAFLMSSSVSACADSAERQQGDSGGRDQAQQRSGLHGGPTGSR